MHKKDQIQIKNIKQGDIALFEQLFKQYYAPLCGYANKLLQDKDQAEELVQDLFYIFWKNRNTIVIHSSIKSYLYKALYHKCLQFIEHEKVAQKYANFVKHHNNEQQSVEGAIYTGELYSKYKNILNELPDRSRQIFTLSRNYGLKYHEIAEKLSISVKTVEANMGVALKAFRKGLAEYR